MTKTSCGPDDEEGNRKARREQWPKYSSHWPCHQRCRQFVSPKPVSIPFGITVSWTFKENKSSDMVSQGQLQSCMLSVVIWKPHETTISFLTPALHRALEQRQLADEERKVVLFFLPAVQLFHDLHSLLSCKVAAKSLLSHEHFWRQWEWTCPAVPAPSAGFKDVGSVVAQGERKDFHSSFMNTWRPTVRVSMSTC